MDKMMDSPWFLRITALLLAMLLFFTIKTDEENLNAATNGSMTDVIRDIQIEVYYDDDNLVVTGVPETVDMTIEGPSSIVQTAKQLQDFKVFVDLRQLNIGEHDVMLQVENVSDKLQVRLDPAYIEVNIEEKITRELRVDPEFNERLLAENYIVTGMKADPDRIQITGAKSVVESISFVKATVVGDDGIDKTFTQAASVKVLDKELSKLNVTIEPEQINVTVEIEEYSKEVPITLRQIGSPKDGVTINELTTEIVNVRTFGNKLAIDALKQIVVDVDVSDLESSKQFKVKIPQVKGVSRFAIPQIEVKADVSAAPNEGATPEESAQIERQKEEINVSVRNFEDVHVEVRGLNERDRFLFVQPKNGQINLTIHGENSIVTNLTASDFQVFVDASEVKNGEHLLNVTVEGPGEVTWTVSIPSITVDVLRA